MAFGGAFALELELDRVALCAEDGSLEGPLEPLALSLPLSPLLLPLPLLLLLLLLPMSS